jgi:hypothetical protein
MKTVKTVSKQVFLAMLAALLFISCEKSDEASGGGNYIYAINNLTNASHAYNIYLDGELKGKIIAESGEVAAATSLCGDISLAQTKENVIVIQGVNAGNHILTIEDTASLNILHTENFTMAEDGCMCQPYTMM